MSRTLSLCLLVVLLCAASNAQDGWQTGRATYYGLDGWSIHKGACGLGYQYKNVGTGWDVAAIADASPEFAGSCGRCYEVRCDPRSAVKDGYGNSFDRSSVCKAGAATVVVRTVDNCPCNYPGNAYSNKRWCCGDNSDTQGTHFDLSIWAFEKLADVKQGVAAVQFRHVPCSYRSSNPAPAGPTGMPASESPSALGYKGTPTDPAGDIYQQKFVMRFDDSGKEQGAVRPMEDYDAGTGATVVTLGDIMSKTGGSSASVNASVNATAVTGSNNGCTDTAPNSSTCQEQKDNGQCGQPWLLKGNYCRATCGRCKLTGSSSSSSSSGQTSGKTSDASGGSNSGSSKSAGSSGDSKSSSVSSSSSGGKGGGDKKDSKPGVKAYSGSSQG